MKYKGLMIDHTHESPSDEEIHEVECNLGRKIPKDYKEFLIKCNGGYLDYELLIEEEYIALSQLYSIFHNGGCETNPFELKHAKNNKLIPSYVLPIATDGGGSILYLDLRHGYQLMASIRGLPEWTKGNRKSVLIKISNSFEEYINKLLISDETAELHIDNFEISESSVRATIDWLDSGNEEWKDKFRNKWNSRVNLIKI